MSSVISANELTQWTVDSRQVDPANGTEALRRVLWTSLPTTSFAAAWQIIEHYERRWLVLEYHKAIRTGCRPESQQFQNAPWLDTKM